MEAQPENIVGTRGGAKQEQKPCSEGPYGWNLDALSSVELDSGAPAPVVHATAFAACCVDASLRCCSSEHTHTHACSSLCTMRCCVLSQPMQHDGVFPGILGHRAPVIPITREAPQRGAPNARPLTSCACMLLPHVWGLGVSALA